jgi:hypothetical protein
MKKRDVRPFERFGWLLSGGLLATRPAVRAFGWLSEALTTGLALFARRAKKPGPRKQ